jgi:hypothetical protein
MIENSTYSKVAVNQTMPLHKPDNHNITIDMKCASQNTTKSDNHYGDICHSEDLEPNSNKKVNFLIQMKHKQTAV